MYEYTQVLHTVAFTNVTVKPAVVMIYVCPVKGGEYLRE